MYVSGRSSTCSSWLFFWYVCSMLRPAALAPPLPASGLEAAGALAWACRGARARQRARRVSLKGARRAGSDARRRGAHVRAAGRRGAARRVAQPVGQRRRKRRAAVRGAPRALPPAAAGPTFSMSTSMPPAAAQQRAGERCETAVGPSVFRDTARLKKRARLRLP
jgi:hypothetical protein